MSNTSSANSLSDHDRREIIDLIVEFVWRLDHQAADTIHELVTEDVSLAPGPLLGKEAVKSWGAGRASVTRATSHLMTNYRFRLVAPDRVESQSMCLVFRHDGEGIGAALPWAVSEYNDIFVRIDGVWKIASHAISDVFASH